MQSSSIPIQIPYDLDCGPLTQCVSPCLTCRSCCNSVDVLVNVTGVLGHCCMPQVPVPVPALWRVYQLYQIAGLLVRVRG
jgi:hypothetical protein